jgi:tRNA/rRNA methyltransferase
MFSLDRIEIVLVSPRNPLNIGAAARAMANFGLSHLTVVAPYEPHWREAKSAIGAEELLQSAKHEKCLEEALAECTLVAGTATLADRRPEQVVVPLPELPPRVQYELDRGGRVALVFGPEKRGLTRDDLALCHLLVEIPTHPRQPSMNLGQAVAVCLYELAAPGRVDSNPLPGDKKHDAAKVEQPASSDPAAAGAVPASSRDLDLLAQVVQDAIEAADYSPAAMQKANRHDLDLLLRRLALTHRDARRILGLFRRILFRLKR